MADEMRAWLADFGCKYVEGLSFEMVINLVNEYHVDGIKGFILANA